MNRVYSMDTTEHGWIETPVSKYKFTAYCTSYQCAAGTDEYKKEHVRGSVKDVAKTTTWCPTCSSALLWERENSKV